jgi:glyoxylase-like metal-dependent hydrolase (beta-lactamase superfamily II)
MIHFCRSVLDIVDPQTRVIPGHGPVMDYGALDRFTSMLATVRDRLQIMLDRGLTLEQVIAAKPTADFDEQFGDPALFVTKAYMSLGR